MKRKVMIYLPIVLFLFFMITNVFADAPPDPGGGPGGGAGPVGGGAPLDGGSFFMIAMGLFYGMKKTCKYLAGTKS
jgi:hypothetical protein